MSDLVTYTSSDTAEMPGNITRRGKSSWRLKFEAGARDLATGKRSTRYVTVHGTKKLAQAELIRLLAEIETGTAISPSSVTVAEYLRAWLDAAAHLAPKTLERYRELADQQIIPYLGKIALQKLRVVHISEWHTALLRSGGRGGGRSRLALWDMRIGCCTAHWCVR